LVKAWKYAKNPAALYFLLMGPMARRICPATSMPFFHAPVPEPLASQYMQPSLDMVPSRLGHVKPASTGIL